MLGNALLTHTEEEPPEDLPEYDVTLQSSFVAELCIPKIEPADNSFCMDEEALEDFSVSESLIPFTTPYKLKDPVIILEKCDKIWKTLTLIKNAQGMDDTAESDTQESESEEEPVEPRNPSPMVNEFQYVQYNPVLEHDNASLPKLYVKTKERVYNCMVCGKLYKKKRDLHTHEYKSHGIQIPEYKTNGHVEEKIEKTQLSEKGKNQITKENGEKVKSNQTTKVKKPVAPSTQENQATLASDPDQRSKTNFTQKIQHHHITTKPKEQKVNHETNHIAGGDREKGAKQDLVKCLLCKRTVRHTEKHFRSYHKIPCSDLMISQLSRPATAEGVQQFRSKSKKQHVIGKLKGSIDGTDHSFLKAREDQEVGQIVLGKRKRSESFHTEPKRKRIGDNNNISDSHTTINGLQSKDKHKCPCCFASYTTADDLSSHRCSRKSAERKGFQRSETTNSSTSLQNNRESKSLETVASEGVVNTISRSKRRSTINGGNERVDTESVNSTPNDKFFNSNKENFKESLALRRLFDDSTHKDSSRRENGVKGEETKESTKSESDSPVDLNITIKKHNDSYEIVGRDDNHDGKSKDSQELSQYSKEHKFIKLEVIDDDITVDIEDDEEANDLDNVNCTPKSEETLPETEINGKENIQIENIHTETARVKTLRLRSRRPDPISLVDGKQITLKDTSKILCFCGEIYESEKLLQEHVTKDHTLLLKKCGYCKMIFKNVIELNDHTCIVVRGEPFVNFYKIPCSYCNVILDIKNFDKHMAQHLGSPGDVFRCHVCATYFKHAETRNRHMAKEHGSRLCHFCLRPFPPKVKAKHDAYHLGLGYPCHSCKISYCKGVNLREHHERHHMKKTDPPT